MALGKGPEATKRSIAAGSLPRDRVSPMASKMSSVPQTSVAMTMGVQIERCIDSPFTRNGRAPPFRPCPSVIDRPHLHFDEMSG